MKLLEYAPFALGYVVGLVIAFAVTGLLSMSDPGRLLVIGFLPAYWAERCRTLVGETVDEVANHFEHSCS